MTLRTLLRASPARIPSLSYHIKSISHASSSSRFSSYNDSTSPLIKVQNIATSYGQLDILLPLPGIVGLTRFELEDGNASVKDVINAVQDIDITLKSVEITTPDGTKLARTVRLSELASMSFCLRLNHMNILIESGVSVLNEKKLREESVAFATVKAAIEKDVRLILPLHEFYEMCHNVGAEEKVGTKWLRELQRRHLVVHFDRSRNPQLENVLILRPYSLESILTLQNSLDSELYNIKHDRKVKERQVTEVMSSIKKLKQIEKDVALAARWMPNVQKWFGLTSLTGFYGTLMYCVWDVYSWDVMEPITYFIGFTTVLGNSFYHAMTKQDPTYSNMWQKRYANRVLLLSKQRNYNPMELTRLEARLVDLEKDLTILMQWEKVQMQDKTL
ncbi:putative calcium uniporter protein [Plasmopara halstedii]